MRALFLTGLIVCSSTTARSTEVLDADAYVTRVLAGPLGAAAAADVGRARADVDAAGLWPNPALRLERQSGPILDQSKGSQDFLAVEIPLVLSGRLGLGRDAALGRVDAAVLDARDRRARLAREALDVFVDVVFAVRRAQAISEERARLAPVVEAARRRADGGETPVASALRLELELARVDDDVAAARAAVDGNRRRAEALAGEALPPFSDRLPETKTASAAPPAAVLALHKRAESAAFEEEAAGRRIIPDVVVGGGPSLLNTGAPDISVGYLVTVGVELPFFDRGQGEAAKARAERASLEAERMALVRRLDALRGDANVRSVATRARSAAFAIAVERAQGLFDAAVRDLAVGAGDVVAFVDAVATLREARLQLLALQETSARADADLSFLSGALESSPEPQ